MTKRVMCAAAIAALFAGPAFAAGSGENQAKQDQKSSAAAGASDKKSQGAGNQPAQGFAVVLVPITVAAKGKQEQGDCWARLYTEDNFRGEQLSLVGPVDMPNMRTPFGHDWSGEFESIAIGPKATVSVYDNENYQQRVANFKPGQKVPELDEKLGFFEQIRSVKIACAGGSRTAKSASGSGTKSGAASGGGKP